MQKLPAKSLPDRAAKATSKLPKLSDVAYLKITGRCVGIEVCRKVNLQESNWTPLI